MLDNTKCKRCVRKAASWYGKTFEEVCDIIKDPANKVEAEEVEASLQEVEAGKEPRFGTRMAVRTFKRSGHRMEMAYLFATKSQFIRRFKYKPSTLGFKVVTLASENGHTELTGVLLKWDSKESDFRKVVLWSETAWMLDEKLMRVKDRLREKEPTLTYTALSKKQSKTASALTGT
jgi:hypothetical protein